MKEHEGERIEFGALIWLRNLDTKKIGAEVFGEL